MKIRWWIALLLIFGLIAGPIIKNIPGFIIVAVNQTTLQIPLWLGVALGLLFILLTGVLLAIFAQFISAAAKAKSWSGSRKWKKARKETLAGMLNFAEGDWEKSEKKMISASKYGDTKLINYLVAAQSAQKQLAFSRRDEYLKRAKTDSPQADVAIGLTQARLQIESSQFEEALATLLLLSEIAPKNKYINKLLVKVNVELEEWEFVLSKIPQLEKQKTYTGEQLKEIHIKAICGVMLNKFDQDQWEELQVFWKQQPRKMKKEPLLVLEYVGLMKSFHRDEEAEIILKKLLKQNISAKALKLYATLKTNKPGKQLDFVESLPLNPEVEKDYYETLSELATTAELWGKSRDYLERSLALDDSVKTRAALANTLVKLGDAEQAQTQREKAVKLLEQEK